MLRGALQSLRFVDVKKTIEFTCTRLLVFTVGRSKRGTRKGSVTKSSEIQGLVSGENVADGCPGQHGGGVTIEELDTLIQTDVVAQLNDIRQ